MSNPFTLESMEGRVLMAATGMIDPILIADSSTTVSSAEDATKDLRSVTSKVEDNVAQKERIRRAQSDFE